MIDSGNARDETSPPEQQELPVETAAESAAATNSETATDQVVPIVRAGTPGTWLRQARADARLSEEQVAKDLFLDTKMIRAIEADRYQEIGAPVYAKGYLRRYAKLLGLAEAAVIERYEAMQGTPHVTDPVPVSHNKIPARRQSLPAWIWWLVVVVVALVAGITWLNGRPLSSVTSIPGTSFDGTSVELPGSAVATTEPAMTPLAAAMPTTDTASGETAMTPLAAGSAVHSNSQGQASPAAVPGMVSVQLKFASSSWVEIYDANQKSVMYDMAASGSTRVVQGTPPLRVKLGSAAGVQLVINGHATAVPAANIRENVANFKINAAGHIE